MLPHCSPATKDGYAIHIYTASTSMHDSCLANADGDFLIVPQQGARLWAPPGLMPTRAAAGCLLLKHGI